MSKFLHSSAVADPGFANGGPRSSAAGASINFFDFRSKNVDFYCILSAIFAVQLPMLQARNTAFGLTKLAAAACMQCTAQRQQRRQTQACWKVETFYKQPL